ncbi:MAG: hypothetical protein ACRDU7_09715 [Acidimicrobiia bacterium]
MLKAGFRKAMPVSIVMTLMLAACSGGAGDTATTTGPDASGATSTTTVAETATSATAESTTTAGEEGPSIEDIPPECLAEISAILQVFEPAVEGIDWETATIMDHIQVMTSLSGTAIGDTAACENVDVDVDVSEEEGVALFLEVAEQEAPGTVGYLQWVQGLAAGFGDAEVSGDCETDISALRAIIEESSSMSDLTMTEVVQVGSLVASVSTACTPDRAEEFFAEPDVAAFLESQ